MTLEQQLTTIESRLQAVGAALADPITDICVGLPVPRGDRSVRISWAGDTDAVRMPGQKTLVSELVGDAVLIRGFWQIPTADEQGHRKRLLEMAAFAHGAREALDTDNDPDGLDAIDVGHAVPDLVNYGGADYAMVEITLTLSYREVEITR